MAIINTIKKLFPTFGFVTNYTSAAAVALSGGTAQTTAVTVGTQGYTNGRVRVKIYNGGGANTTAAVVISVTDGTNTWIVGALAAQTIANAAAGGLDFVTDVNVDLQIATVNIITTLGGTTTTASMDYEICLNP